jgi:hypothetical protein
LKRSTFNVSTFQRSTFNVFDRVMTTAEPTSPTVVHAFVLLAEPKLGAQPLALVWGGERVAPEGYVEGFLRVRRDSMECFLPAAVCEPLAAAPRRGGYPMTEVAQSAWLHRRVPPGGHAASPWIIGRGETLVALGREKRFVQVRRADGQVGYVPEVLCEPILRTADGAQLTRARQPIALYQHPAPGGQFSHDRILAPREQLCILGGDSGFLLVQRASGQVGYVAAALCGRAAPDALLKVGPLDLGWMAIGLLWALPNLGALLLALRQARLVEAAMRPYAGIGIALAMAAALWFAGRRPYVARSFAIGVLLAYALLHYDSAGWLTFWM